jgi:hypothetical protein
VIHHFLTNDRLEKEIAIKVDVFSRQGYGSHGLGHQTALLVRSTAAPDLVVAEFASKGIGPPMMLVAWRNDIYVAIENQRPPPAITFENTYSILSPRFWRNEGHLGTSVLEERRHVSRGLAFPTNHIVVIRAGIPWIHAWYSDEFSDVLDDLVPHPIHSPDESVFDRSHESRPHPSTASIG